MPSLLEWCALPENDNAKFSISIYQSAHYRMTRLLALEVAMVSSLPAHLDLLRGGWLKSPLIFSQAMMLGRFATPSLLNSRSGSSFFSYPAKVIPFIVSFFAWPTLNSSRSCIGGHKLARTYGGWWRKKNLKGSKSREESRRRHLFYFTRRTLFIIMVLKDNHKSERK